MNVLFAYDRSQYCEYAMNSLRQLSCVAEIDLSLVTVIPFLPIADWTTSVYVNDPSPLRQAALRVTCYATRPVAYWSPAPAKRPVRRPI